MDANLINQNNNKENNEKISLEPNKIYLFKLIDNSIKANDRNLYEGRLLLKNNTDNYLVFKFSNTLTQTNTIYSITPISYYLNPRGTININIKRFNKVKKKNKNL